MTKATERPRMGDLIKQLPNSSTPMQEVRPVEPESKKGVETPGRISAMWVPAELSRKLKVHAAESGKTIRKISIEAYKLYFNQLIK